MITGLAPLHGQVQGFLAIGVVPVLVIGNEHKRRALQGVAQAIVVHRAVPGAVAEGKNRHLADFLPTLTIAAKNLATEMTNYNVEGKNLFGETAITQEHMQNNQSVREMLGKRGIRPEELPPAEDVKKLECRVASEEKKIEKTTSKLPKKK